MEQNVITIVKTLRKGAFTVTELEIETGLSRDRLRVTLAYMLGQNLVEYRPVGMAKLYRLKIKERKR